MVQILDQALEMYGDDLAIAFSGAEDVALIQYASMTGKKFRVFSLDTGRLNPETYQLFDDVEKLRHQDRVHVPGREGGDGPREREGHVLVLRGRPQECCGVRKVQPLRRKLKTLKAWVTGQRKDQSPGTRMAVPAVQVDPVFEGLEGGPGSLVKFNPLTNATSQEVWDFLRVMGTPVNKLHEMGSVSIGSRRARAPCSPGSRSAGALVVGGQRHEGVRPAQREHDRGRAGEAGRARGHGRGHLRRRVRH